MSENIRVTEKRYSSLVIVSESVVRHLGGFKIYFSNTSSRQEGYFVHEDKTITAENIYNISLPNIVTRSIEVQRFGILTICEILVLQGGKKVVFFFSLIRIQYKILIIDV